MSDSAGFRGAVVKLTRTVQFLTALCLATSCAATPMASSPPLNPSTLNAQPSLYNGKNVEVRGYVILAPESHVLYESKELIEGFRKKVDDTQGKGVDLKDYIKYCLTIANPAFFYRNSAALDGQTLTLRGKFVDDYLNGRVIDLGACAARTAIFVDIDDFKKRHAATSWK